MENLLFYPTLTPDLLDAAGFSADNYVFRYSYQNNYYGLQQKGTNVIKLSDPLEIWTIESEGLLLTRTVRFAYPELLKGPSGIACKNASLGVCIIWTNKKLTQTGIILPESDINTSQGRICKFNHSFPPITVSGDLELELTLFIKEKAEKVFDDERDLINDAGVTVGVIERVVLDFNSLYMEFPIEEYRSEKEPLWWVEFSEWEDPKTVDTFSKDSLCLYLNPYYDACPAPSTNESGNHIKNFDVLVEILSQVYYLMFKRLTDDELKATKQDIGLSNNSICSVLHEFIEECKDYHELQWESDEKLLKSLQMNLRKKLLEGLQ
jgi:hypothetical protein